MKLLQVPLPEKYVQPNTCGFQKRRIVWHGLRKWCWAETRETWVLMPAHCPAPDTQALFLQFLFSFSCYLFWEVHPIACRILVPWPEIKPLPPALEVQGLNHWTAWEVALPALSFLHQLTQNDHSPLSQKCDTVLWDNVPDSPLKKPVSKVKNGNLHIFPNVITQTDLAVLYLCICFLILKVCIPFGQVDYNYLLLKWKLYAFFSRSLCAWCIRLLPDTFNLRDSNLEYSA